MMTTRAKSFCRCPDCGRRLKQISLFLRRCSRCRQSFSVPYLKGYWLGVERTKQKTERKTP
jgi:hypothetical protein